MAVSYKAIALANDMMEKLNARFNGALTFALSADTDGQPVLSAGSGTAGAENIVIKLSNYLVAQNALAAGNSAPTPYKDELGLAANPFSPTILQVTTEAAGTGTLGTGANATSTITISSGSGTLHAVVGGTDVSVTWATSDNATATALAAAITGDAKANKLVTAVASTNTVVVTAKPGLGTLGNSIGLTVSGTGISATGSGYLVGGTVAGGNAGLNSLVKLTDLVKVLGEAFPRDCITEVYLSAAGTAPSTSNGSLVATFTISSQYPAMSVN
jgi:hypothetical protein